MHAGVLAAQEMVPPKAVVIRRVVSALGGVALVAWALWWIEALTDFDLRFAGRMWLVFPAFGADFWSQSEYAARMFASGLDPYEPRVHLFHYPPIVIRLFLWVNYFTENQALRIWVLCLIAVLIVGAVVAYRARERLGLRGLPLTWAVALVLFSFPVLFQLERSNFDLFTLAAILGALPLLSREGALPEFAGGALLAIGPWVKLYPGLMGIGLVALRRRWAVLGFAVFGVLIGLAAPAETMRSFKVLGVQMGRMNIAAAMLPFPPWSHSLSAAWIHFVSSAHDTKVGAILQKVPASVVAGAIVAAAVSSVCWKVFRSRGSRPLTYPLLLWINAVASCAPVIANDYSLAFYPLAAVAACGLRDPWASRIGLALSVVAWQPLAFPVNALWLFGAKLAGLAAVGVSLVTRSTELSRAAARGDADA